MQERLLQSAVTLLATLTLTIGAWFIGILRCAKSEKVTIKKYIKQDMENPEYFFHWIIGFFTIVSIVGLFYWIYWILYGTI